LLTLPTASLSSTVVPVSVPPTLLVSFPSNKKLWSWVVSAFTDVFGRKRIGFSRRRKTATEVVDDNEFYDSTIRRIVFAL
jgi:hypothetical protein